MPLALLLVEDRQGIDGLAPQKGAKSAHWLVSPVNNVIPLPGSPAPRVTGPEGPQAFYVLLTRPKLPQVLYSGLLTKDRRACLDTLDDIVAEFMAKERGYQWDLLKAPFIAVYPR